MELRCSECGREFGNAGGLASHMLSKHGAGGDRGPNRRALEQTLDELKQMGKLERIDAAQIQAARSLADAVDKDDGNAYLWRTYREAVEGLVKRDDKRDAFEKLLEEINSSAPVGHSPKT